ncbi:hypothetical protein BKA69DRAFT_1066907 [Paraphysoderma sedebokerense]|nr:hypothetical protein BKA69DRAFT_1066907 [Paraphysoderma sedebokerense]
MVSSFIEIIPEELTLKVLKFCDDTDLRTLLYVNHRFRRLASDILLWRYIIHHRNKSEIAARLFASLNRPTRENLVQKNILHGGYITRRLIHEGEYINGPIHSRSCEVAVKLNKFIIRKRLSRGLHRRPSFEDLKERNVLPPEVTSTAATLLRNATSLRYARNKAALSKKLTHRRSFEDLSNAGVVPIQTIVKSSAEYPSLLARQVTIDRHLRDRKLKRNISRTRPRRQSEVARVTVFRGPSNKTKSQLSQFLRNKRPSPTQLIQRKYLIQSPYTARMICPDVKSKIKYFEDIAQTIQQRRIIRIRRL